MTPCFVTGASGFIGGRLVERLRASGRPVRALARRPLPALERMGAEIVLGDLHDPAALARGCAGAGTVFHVAGRVGVWGPPRDFLRVNVDGTRAVLAAARAAGVPRFVYTSSPSVVYSGGDLAGVDEAAPLCRAAPCAYPTSKAAAEALVLAANAPGFATTALRPHLVWGPGDRNVVPRVLALAAKGRLRIVGTGANRVDLTHIDNVVDAHLLAERALGGGRPPDDPGPAAGRAYFITNGEPVLLWDWINALLRALGRPPVTRRVSLRAAYLVGGALELGWRVLPLAGEPPMTRFVAKELATDHWFRIDAARRDLGYAPRVSMAEGTAQLVAELRSS
ncbi:MAG TPA: NAD-dependent epimerase/dehydratase family protein [Opitutaceae bacterium]|nr:NAD-dependent epimerase/dehydratase family protein [Opitutaceae bacterium]